MTFDYKLTWHEHIKQLKSDCIKRMNIMKVLANNTWGADEKTLLTIYRTLIRSKLDYGSIIYATASKTLLKSLNVVQNTALRIATGAFITSPSQSLCKETGEIPLFLRRQMLQMTYAARISADEQNPLQSQIYGQKYRELYNKQPKLRSPFYHQVNLISDSNFPDTLSLKPPKYPPWTSRKIDINITLTSYKKNETVPAEFQQKFLEIISELNYNEIIYTDASKSTGRVGCAYLTNRGPKKFKLPSDCSIFTAELIAILQALEYVKKTKITHSIICTDSLSAIQAILEIYSKNPIVNNIKDLFTSIDQEHNICRLIWVPSHCGIAGNEEADRAAKEASFDGQEIAIMTTYDLSNKYKTYIRNKWENIWQNQRSKLALIDPSTTYVSPSVTITKRRDLVIFRRLRIGHTRVTHNHLLVKEDVPRCATCDADITVQHILIDCQLYLPQRNHFNVSESMKEALRINSPLSLNTLDFIKNINVKI
ncbi:uncharacterized protein LOC123313966 [Coccinella septempunctata]|uniref:uncharacterized protein LOC123313966 n=1 Tax=Coccinella septempunctata TaxID=41139 RepID=UPI001D07EDC8|nr:uncharacterized protein LOC123313966 [Coccinella septempunctata]